MHPLIVQIDAVARACYQIARTYPQHLYVGPRTASALKAMPLADALNPKSSTDIRNLIVLGMKVHPRMTLGERIITSVQPLSDVELLQQFPTTEDPYAQDIAAEAQ